MLPVAAVWARGRESAALLAATELVFFAAITGTRCVTIGSRVPSAGAAILGCPQRGALGAGSVEPAGACREHLLVSPDHRDDDGTPKCVEFLVIHLEGSPHFAERLVPLSSGNSARLKQSWLIANALFNCSQNHRSDRAAAARRPQTRLQWRPCPGPSVWLHRTIDRTTASRRPIRGAARSRCPRPHDVILPWRKRRVN